MLTEFQIKHAKAQGKPYRLRDGGGLFLEVRPTGSKVFIFRYTLERRRNTVRIGRYGAITLKQARIKAQELANKVDQGQDPAREKREQKRARVAQAIAQQGADRFEAVAFQWLTRYSQSLMPVTHKRIHAQLCRYILPQIGRLRLEEITEREIMQTMDEASKNAPSIRGVVLDIVRGVVDYATLQQIPTARPNFSALRKTIPQALPVNRAHITPQELPEFIQALERAPASEPVRLYVKLLLLTFPRRSELLALRPEWIDHERGTITIPSQYMKGRRYLKEGRALEHTISLSTQATRLLNRLLAIAPIVEQPFAGVNYAKALNLIYEAGYKGRQTLHGFRTVASTWLNEQRPEYETIIEKMLAHKTGNAVKRVYDKSRHEARKKELWQLWGDFLESQGLKT